MLGSPSDPSVPGKFWPLLALYHLLPLHFPITTWGFDVPWGRFSSPSRFNLNGNIAWFIMEIVSPITFAWTLQNPAFPYLEKPSLILAICFGIHYSHRAIISPLILSPWKSPMHISAPISAIAYNALNGYCMAVYLAFYGPTQDSPLFYLCILGWAFGFIGNSKYPFLESLTYDEHLNNLRRTGRRLVSSPDEAEKEDKKCGNGRYAIPRLGLFKLVSFPNYFCEWCEWTFFAIAAGDLFIRTPPLSALSPYLPTSLYESISSIDIWPSYLLSPPWMFVVFEISCMLPRAINSHRWYKKTFGDRYPKERKIVIPYLL